MLAFDLPRPSEFSIGAMKIMDLPAGLTVFDKPLPLYALRYSQCRFADLQPGDVYKAHYRTAGAGEKARASHLPPLYLQLFKNTDTIGIYDGMAGVAPTTSLHH